MPKLIYGDNGEIIGKQFKNKKGYIEIEYIYPEGVIQYGCRTDRNDMVLFYDPEIKMPVQTLAENFLQGSLAVISCSARSSFERRPAIERFLGRCLMSAAMQRWRECDKEMPHPNLRVFGAGPKIDVLACRLRRCSLFEKPQYAWEYAHGIIKLEDITHWAYVKHPYEMAWLYDDKGKAVDYNVKKIPNHVYSYAKGMPNEPFNDGDLWEGYVEQQASIWEMYSPMPPVNNDD